MNSRYFHTFVTQSTDETEMFKILFLLLLGVGIGYVLRNIRGIHRVDQTAHYTILLLLFVFGVTIGSNHDLIKNIAYFGWQALVIAVLGMLGSFGAGCLFNHYITKKEEEQR